MQRAAGSRLALVDVGNELAALELAEAVLCLGGVLVGAAARLALVQRDEAEAAVVRHGCQARLAKARVERPEVCVLRGRGCENTRSKEKAAHALQRRPESRSRSS